MDLFKYILVFTFQGEIYINGVLKSLYQIIDTITTVSLFSLQARPFGRGISSVVPVPQGWKRANLLYWE